MPKTISRPDTIKFLVDVAMKRKKINTHRDLCSYLPFGESCFSKKLKGESRWLAADIRALHTVLNFTPEELETFVMCTH